MKKLHTMRIVILVVASIAFTSGTGATSMTKITRIDSVRAKVITRIDELWDETANWQMLAKKKQGLDGELVDEFKKICDDIDSVPTPEMSNSIFSQIWRYELMNGEENNVLSAYSTFRKLQIRPDPVIFGDLWKQLANSVIKDQGDKRSIVKSLAIIQELIDDGIEGHQNIFQETFENSDDLSCEVNQSPQQMMFNLYTTFQLTQLKAYTMIHFSWMLLRIYDQGNFEVENGLLKQTYWQRMSQQANALQNVIKDCKSELWACDSVNHSEGETYTKITKFLQGYIVNEVDLNSDGTCRENCAFYTYAKQQGCFKNQFCSRQPTCRGNIVGCSFVDSDMLICQAPHLSERRYDWIRYENGRTLGQGRSCNRGVESVDSWWRYLFWHCSYCFCYCDDPKDSQSDRYFSLRPVTADTDKNKVVTGLKFVKNNRIIHIQIQQGELLPHGEINETTIEWLPIDNFEVTDNDVVAGKDYHLLTWEHRSFDLDDLVVNAGQVMTGIKIKLLGSHMNIEIQGAEFNYTTGKLSHGGTKTQWYSNDNTDVAYSKPRTEHNLQKADVPDRSFGLNKPDSKPDTYIRFSPSDPDFDAAQSTVPYIDIQAVSPKPASALVGAGIFHKGREYSGGYLAPKVFTFNQGDHLQKMFPDLNETEF